MKYVVTRDEVEPSRYTGQLGHYGGTGWSVINSENVGSEALRITYTVYPPGGYTKDHPVHEDREQVYCVLSGIMSLRIGGEEHTVRTGAFVFVPRGVEHNHRNEGPEDLVFITVNCPVRSGEVPPLPQRE